MDNASFLGRLTGDLIVIFFFAGVAMLLRRLVRKINKGGPLKPAPPVLLALLPVQIAACYCVGNWISTPDLTLIKGLLVCLCFMVPGAGIGLFLAHVHPKAPHRTTGVEEEIPRRRTAALQ